MDYLWDLLVKLLDGPMIEMAVLRDIQHIICSVSKSNCVYIIEVPLVLVKSCIIIFSLQLNQQCEDRSVLRYVYYYLARILSDTGAQGLSTGGGIPTPNWDALADIDAVGGVTRADVVPRIVEQLTAEAKNADVECEFF